MYKYVELGHQHILSDETQNNSVPQEQFCGLKIINIIFLLSNSGMLQIYAIGGGV